MKRGLILIAAVLVLAAVVLILLPFFVDLGRYKTQYLPLVEEALGRKVDVGTVRLRILPAPAIQLSQLNISDDPAFSQGSFFTAGETRLRLKLWPLLRGQFLVDEFVLKKPVASLLKRPDGTFNFSTLGKKKGEKEKKETPEEKKLKSGGLVRISELIPSRIRVQDGEITVLTKGEKPFNVKGIALSIENFSPSGTFPYRAALAPSGMKPIVLEGRASYSESEGSLGLKDSRLKIQDVNFAFQGGLMRLNENPRADLTLSNDAFETKSVFQLLSEAGMMPKGMEISGPMGLRISAKGPFDNLMISSSTDLKALLVNDPKVFKGTVTGKAQVNVSLGGKGPVTQSIQGGGKVMAQDGVLTNVDLVSKIQLLTGLIGIPADQRGGATTFKTLESDFTLGGGLAQFQRISLLSPVLEANGGGKMTLAAPTLDLSIEAALSPQASARAGSGKGATFFKDEKGRVVIPLKVQGPANKPSVDLDKEKLLKKGLGQALEKAQGQLFDRFLKKK